MGKAEFTKNEEFFDRLHRRDNIALLALLKVTDDSSTSNQKPQYIFVATVHVHWDPNYKDVKVVQTALFLEEIQNFIESHRALVGHLFEPGREKPPIRGPSTYYKNVPIIICGDFNSTPDSGVCEYIRNSSIPGDHPDLGKASYGSYSKDGLAHHFHPLKSGYDGIEESILKFTNLTPTFQGVIDHIWTSAAIGIEQVMAGIDQDYARSYKGFPTQHVPSDHIPIGVDIRCLDTSQDLDNDTDASKLHAARETNGSSHPTSRESSQNAIESNNLTVRPQSEVGTLGRPPPGLVRGGTHT